jgi:hypothetical protein
LLQLDDDVALPIARLERYQPGMGADWEIPYHAAPGAAPVMYRNRRPGAATRLMTRDELVYATDDPIPGGSAVGAPVSIGNAVVARVERVDHDRFHIVTNERLIDLLEQMHGLEKALTDIAEERTRSPERAGELDRAAEERVEAAARPMFGMLQVQQYWLRNEPTWRIAALTAARVNPPTQPEALAQMVLIALRAPGSEFELESAQKTGADPLWWTG